ncbi:unnamed protein product [Calypogeia fissa]
MKGAQERKKDHEGPRQQLVLKEDQQHMNASSGQSSPSNLSLIIGQPSPRTAIATPIETPGRIGRQRSFVQKSLFEPTSTQSDSKTPRKEHRGPDRTPTFMLERQDEAPEESVSRKKIVRRPTGWVPPKHVEWNESLEDNIDEDEKDPPTEDTSSTTSTSSTKSTSSTPSSKIQRHVNDQLNDGDRKYLSKRRLSPLFSTPIQLIAHKSHFIGSLKQKLDFKVNHDDTTVDMEGNKCPLGHMTSSPSSCTSSSPMSTTSSEKSQYLNEPLENNYELAIQSHIKQDLCTNRLHLNTKLTEQEEVALAGPKNPSPGCIIPAKHSMRSVEVQCLGRRSSSGLPTQESDLLKEWTQKCLNNLQEREAKSRDGQKKVLEAAQKARDAFYKQRNIELNMKRAETRQQEKQKMDEILNSKCLESMNKWELVVSLVNIERPIGPPIEKDEGLLGTQSQSKKFSTPPSMPAKALASKSDIKQDNTGVSGAGSEDIAITSKPYLKNTDLSRMKEILIKLKKKQPTTDGAN